MLDLELVQGLMLLDYILVIAELLVIEKGVPQLPHIMNLERG